MNIFSRFWFLAQQGVLDGAPSTGEAGEAVSEGARQAPQQGACGAMSPLWMVVFFIGMMYFLLIRPQKKQQQKQQEMLGALKMGDRVVTSGGLIGTIKVIDGQVVTLELSERVTVKIKKEHIAGLHLDVGGQQIRK